jgi:hypothetical protein
MEDFMVHLFEDCNLCAIHAKRVTISARFQTLCILLSRTERSAEGPAACTPNPRAHLRRLCLLMCCSVATELRAGAREDLRLYTDTAPAIRDAQHWVAYD